MGLTTKRTKNYLDMTENLDVENLLFEFISTNPSFDLYPYKESDGSTNYAFYITKSEYQGIGSTPEEAIVKAVVYKLSAKIWDGEKWVKN